MEEKHPSCAKMEESCNNGRKLEETRKKVGRKCETGFSS
jgi:hypothetical protein